MNLRNDNKSEIRLQNFAIIYRKRKEEEHKQMFTNIMSMFSFVLFCFLQCTLTPYAY